MGWREEGESAPVRRTSTYKGVLGEETLTCSRNYKVARTSGERVSSGEQEGAGWEEAGAGTS